MYKNCLCIDMDNLEKVGADHKALTVGELRSLLDLVPEDAEVMLVKGRKHNSDVGYTFFSERIPVSDHDLLVRTIIPELEVES